MNLTIFLEFESLFIDSRILEYLCEINTFILQANNKKKLCGL